MPHNSFIAWEVEGLCVGGYGVGGSKEVGYVLFMRKYPGSEKDRFYWIQHHVLFPFINKIRREYDHFDASAGAPIPRDMFAINYCDGDNSQLETIVDEKGILAHAEHKVTANKHSASRTGAEQAKDLDKQFITGKKLNKTTTVSHIPSSQHLLKRAIEKKFKDESDRLRVRKKRRTMVDYLAKYPTIETKACEREKIVSGYIANGMVDPTIQRVPYILQIISTCKRQISTKEWEL